MKKTLIAILALSGLAMADQELTWSFGTTVYEQSNNGGSYSGVAFKLSTDSDRYTADVFAFDQISSATLTSIQILSRNNNDTDIPVTLSLMVVDGNGALVGVSNSHTHTAAQMNGLQYTRRISTFSFGTEEAPITLSTNTNYYAYFVTEEKAAELTNDFVLTSDNYGQTVTSATLFAYQGKNPYTDSATNWGLQNGFKSVASSGFVPNMKVNVTVPEPATATLSLLALAGLAARRRRH